jgi:hypothetical protein
MLSVCQCGSMRDDIWREAILLVCDIAIVADGTLARDAPGIAHLKTMTALDRPVPELISVSAQHFHASLPRPSETAYAVA